MKGFLFAILILLTACGGSLTDEQRKRLKEGMELNQIKKLSDAQITDAAFAMGRSLAEIIEKQSGRKPMQLDSIQRHYKVKILFLQPGDSLLFEIEKQIVDAYTSGSAPTQLSDNVQRIGSDTLLYTKPVMKNLPDGSVQFSYALGIRLPVKQVVLSIK